MDADVTLPLVLAGAALAATGALRLARITLAAMPTWLAAVAVVCGAGVAAVGVVLPPVEDPAPGMPLRPVAPGTESPAPTETTRDVESVSGTVRLASGEPVAGAVVQLRTFDRTDEVATTEAATGPDGRYAFEDLRPGPATAYVVQTTHDGAVFSSDLVIPGPHWTLSDTDLVVAPVTRHPDAIRVDVDSTVLAGDEQGIHAVHILRVRNSTERAYDGGLELPLIPGASGFFPRAGLVRPRLAFADDAVVSAQPVLPGTHEIVYEYTVPPGGPLAWNRTVAHDTERVELLLAGPWTLDAENLRQQSDVELGEAGRERAYRRWSASGLDTGTELQISLGEDAAGGAPRTALVVAAALAAAGILGYPLLRRRRGETPLAAEDASARERAAARTATGEAEHR